MRVPRTGGVARAFLLTRPESVVWTASATVPAPAEFLAFDQEAGSIAFVDAKGIARRLDLRLGGAGAAAPASAKLASFASADGSNIFALQQDGAVVRLSPSGEAWKFVPRTRARDLFPQDDGTLVVLGRRGRSDILWRLRPPGDRVLDSAALDIRDEAVRAQVGDRLYFGSDSGLAGIRVRTMERVPAVVLDMPARAIAASPSGDRIFVVTEGDTTVQVVDRYQGRVGERIPLPGAARSLRMDPLGRYLLARPVSGDSAWVIAVGTSRVLGSVRTRWLPDLPQVAPDGALLLADGGDVTVVDGETLRARTRIPGGAADFWIVLQWNGFRPRAAGLDEPVAFAGLDSTPADSTDSTRVDSAAAQHGQAEAPVAATPPPPAGFVVSFASFPSEASAREVASQIRIDGRSPRVVAAHVDSTTVYRVILGPYASRADADRAGRESGRSYWVFEGTP